MRASSRHGFTLIELSIVLVIIGLIVGGILVGRELIHAAEIRSQISQLNAYETATNAFRNKYNCYPGMCTNGLALGLGVNSHGAPHAPCAMIEVQQAGDCSEPASNETPFFMQLRYAQMMVDISLDTINGAWPVAKLPGRYLVLRPEGYDPLVQTVLVGPATLSSPCHASGNNFDFCGSMVALDAFSIDSKLDDGYPLTGKVLGLGDWVDFADAVQGPAGAGTDACVANDTVPFSYNVLNSKDFLCAVLDRMFYY
jgi:prepilin-type N-terminal cleavage/methylation domain-containing protein